MILLAGKQFCSCSQAELTNSKCIAVSSGAEALAHLMSGECNKAVLGAGLSTFCALDILELWRSVDRTVPVILLWDTEDWEALRRGVQLGISDFWTDQPSLATVYRAMEPLSPAAPSAELDEDLLAPTPKLLTLYRACIARLAQQLPVQRCMAAGTILQHAIRQRMATAYPWLGRYLPKVLSASTLSDLEMQLSDEFTVLRTLFPKGSSQSFREILTYILTHMDREPHQPEIAAAFYLSSSALSQMFTRELGRSFRSYVSECRLLRAASLLSELNAAQVAEQLGYQDYSYFTKQFRKRFGQFPAEYQSNTGKERTSCTQPIE